MRLFLLPPSFSGQDTLELTGKDANYLANALRLKAGQQITGRDRDGKTWLLTIRNVKKGSVTVSAQSTDEAVQTTDALPENRPEKRIILCQCLPKGRKMDEIIKRATEMGVTAVIPVKSRNCVSDASEKKERYDALVREAVQQSGSLVNTVVAAPVLLQDLPSLIRTEFARSFCGLLFHQNALEENQKSLLSLLLSQKDQEEKDAPYVLIVGPEGGFEEQECRFLMDNGFHPVLLKTNILRCETASLYAVSAVQAICESLV